MSQQDDFNQNHPRSYYSSREQLLPSTPSAPSSPAVMSQESLAGIGVPGDDDILLYQRISHRLKAELGEAVWRAWIKPLALVGIDEGCLTLSAASEFLRDRIVTNYADRIRYIASYEQKSIHALNVILENELKGSAGVHTSAKMVGDNGDGETHAAPSQHLPLQHVIATDESVRGLDPRYRFSTFVVGAPNQLAYATARRVAEQHDVSFNPLFLYGGVGLGKTHLMHAIAWEIHARQPHRKVLYISAEKFMYRFIRALRFKDMMSFKEQFRSVDVLMVDDVQFISGKDSTQEEFFHTFNALVEDGKQVVLSADKSPTDLAGMEERLRSRMGWGMVADIHPADYELRLGILQARREQAGIDISDKVLEFLATRITSNIREIEGAFNRIVAHATLVGREITIETSREVLSDLLRANNRRVSVDEIQKKVAHHFSIKVSDMFSARRARQIARPRQIAMFLAKNLTAMSYPEIGKRFGNRDHTTIMHAVRKIEALMSQDAELCDDIHLIKSLLIDQ